MQRFAQFTNFIQSTNNVCIYHLQSEYIPSKLYFPNASSVTLIRCSKEGVNNILKPTIFPNLTCINYLSLHPGDVSIYNRFSKSVSWIFPTKPYSFYDCMTCTGLGKKDPTLIASYIANIKYNKQIEYDLHIPSYGVIDGEIYRYHFLHLLSEYYFTQITHEHHFQDHFQKYNQDKIDNDFFEHLLAESNHLDATPSHSSNK